MVILAIETSCDETSIAFLESDFDAVLDSDNFLGCINSFKIVAHTISTQVATHAQYGGVIPEIGARLHAEQIHYLFEKTVREALENKDLVDELLAFNATPSLSALPLQGGEFIVQFFESSKVKEFLTKIDYICVTTEPGLRSALRVGEEFAKTIQFYVDLKYQKEVEIIKVNHLKGHVFSSFFDFRRAVEVKKHPVSSAATPQEENFMKSDLEAFYDKSTSVFPHLHLLVSGGNSQLLLLKSPFESKIIGQTLDDAAGECFDKTARMFGLDYPGGVTLSKIAGLEDINYLDLPISMKNSGDLNFSFSGLKTAVRYYIQKNDLLEYETKLSESNLNLLLNNDLDQLKDERLVLIKKLCISIQSVITEQLIHKLKKAKLQFTPKSIGLSGGVSANNLLRSKIKKISVDCKLFTPDLSLTGDNAVMIGLAGAIQIQ